jgi:hypothetical protein
LQLVRVHAWQGVDDEAITPISPARIHRSICERHAGICRHTFALGERLRRRRRRPVLAVGQLLELCRRAAAAGWYMPTQLYYYNGSADASKTFNAAIPPTWPQLQAALIFLTPTGFRTRSGSAAHRSH